MKISILFIFLSLCLTLACKRQQRVPVAVLPPVATQTGPTEVPLPPQVVPPPQEPEQEKIDVEEIDFRYFVSRSKVSFKSKQGSIDNADVSIRIKKDSIIWFNVGQLGFTGAKALITQDSVFLMNILEKTYYKFGYDTLSKRFGVKVNFDLLQSVIVGNMPLKMKAKKIQKEDTDYYIIRQDEGRVLVDNYIGKKDRKLRKLKAVALYTNNTLTLNFDGFEALNSYLFPYSSLITVDTPATASELPYQTVIELRHKKVEITESPQSFPFSIPTKYERRY